MYNSIYLVSHSILNYERLTEERKEPPGKLPNPGMKTFVAACLFSAYRRYLCIFSLKIYIFSLKMHIFKLKIEIFSLAFSFFSGMFLSIYPVKKKR